MQSNGMLIHVTDWEFIDLSLHHLLDRAITTQFNIWLIQIGNEVFVFFRRDPSALNILGTQRHDTGVGQATQEMRFRIVLL